MTSDRRAAYRAFVADNAARQGADGYLFEAPRCRFALEPSDELVAPPGLRLRREAEAAIVELEGGGRLPISGIGFDKVRAVFSALPCRYSRLVLELGPQCDSFVEQAFSRVLFAPAAVAALEIDLPGLEIVRFPGSPYEIVRPYWRNSVAVRRRIEARGVPDDQAGLRELLLELHELMLLGESESEGRSSFYLPASVLGRKRPTPGSFYEAPTGLERRGSETILTGGARVSAPLLGGSPYWQLLAESVSDPEALAPERELTEAGVSLGQLVRARAEQEAQARPWFLPPRPLLDAHFEGLLEALRRSHSARHDADLLAALATFHHRFVRVHPLPSANQSLSMSFVNAVLRRRFGAGIPHLLLDQLALRFDSGAYRKLFSRAVRAWCVPFPNPGERMRQLSRMTKMLNQLVSDIGSAPSLIEARALLPSLPYAADLALLKDGESQTDAPRAGDEQNRIG
jgi:hypothetical protein